MGFDFNYAEKSMKMLFENYKRNLQFTLDVWHTDPAFLRLAAGTSHAASSDLGWVAKGDQHEETTGRSSPGVRRIARA